MAEEKTNVMRTLEQKKVPYTAHCYVETGETNGVKVAALLGEPPERVFKTLVTVGKTGKNYVFVIPVAEELDLKKAAKAVGEKSIAMIKAKELLPLTGYVHGGCSPIGMKKFFRTTIHMCPPGRSATRSSWRRRTLPVSSALTTRTSSWSNSENKSFSAIDIDRLRDELRCAGASRAVDVLLELAVRRIHLTESAQDLRSTGVEVLCDVVPQLLHQRLGFRRRGFRQ